MQTAHLNGKHFLHLTKCNLVGESDATGPSHGVNGFCLETRLCLQGNRSVQVLLKKQSLDLLRLLGFF